VGFYFVSHLPFALYTFIIFTEFQLACGNLEVPAIIRRFKHRLFTHYCPIVEDNLQDHIKSHALLMALNFMSKPPKTIVTEILCDPGKTK
jgi:hypothetical protein